MAEFAADENTRTRRSGKVYLTVKNAKLLGESASRMYAVCQILKVC
jgi:hypothetical protein